MDGMPPVSQCDVEACFYNRNAQCHAPAINVGGMDHPSCDTFIEQSSHIGRMSTSAVGACHTSLCKYNNDLLCTAAGIKVGWHAQHADCSTFETKK